LEKPVINVILLIFKPLRNVEKLTKAIIMMRVEIAITPIISKLKITRGLFKFLLKCKC